jgi:protein-L-isoaspartate(D-aspartate) O-methyltransferase
MTSGPEADRRELAAAAERWAHTREDRWAPVPPELDRAIAADERLAGAALWARRHLVRDVSLRLGALVSTAAIARYADALVTVPRERFVIPEEIAASADDLPSPLDRSAPHAYLLTYGLLDVREGDVLLELGTGTGYGAALASRIVGAPGRVTSIEIDPRLHARAARLLAEPALRGPAALELLLGDATALAPREAAKSAGLSLRVAVTYALAEPPGSLLGALPEGAVLVAPVGEEDQLLVRWERDRVGLRRTTHGAVRYVAERR